jgi:hypothetical protein
VEGRDVVEMEGLREVLVLVLVLALSVLVVVLFTCRCLCLYMEDDGRWYSLVVLVSECGESAGEVGGRPEMEMEAEVLVVVVVLVLVLISTEGGEGSRNDDRD